MPDRCDMTQGPCACGAWHDKVLRIPEKTLLQAAKDLRQAQREYMTVRALEIPDSHPTRIGAGKAVARAAAVLDEAIDRTEKRQDADLAAGLLLLNKAKELLTGISERLEARHGKGAITEPSLGEQREMGVHPSGGEIIP